MLGSGGLKRVPDEFARNYRAAIPPIAEQSAITAALERETTRIDALIAKKTRFIELLKEKRQALITHAVTKGLDPNVKMKDSGVEWIGEVPEHWKVRRLGSLYREAVRTGDPSLPILSISIHDGITDDELAPEDRDRQVYQIEDRTKYKRVRPNDLAYNMMRAWQGAFGAVAVDGLVSPAYVVAEPTGEIRSAYIENLLRTPMAVEEMRRFSRGIADFRMRLYWEYFRDLHVCLPPLDEQDEILADLARHSTRMEKLGEATELSITLLKERRSALITAAVTGKIDLVGGDSA
jgi:type I restriction enzyme S subunit